MMHGTTSPFYPLIASLDVAAAMMDEPAGPTLMDETIADAISFRKAMSSIAHRLRTEAENGEAGSSASTSPSASPIPATAKSILFEDAEDELLATEPPAGR
jgi:arginine decarboxylase